MEIKENSRSGKFEVVTSYEATNPVGEKHTVKQTLAAFATQQEAEDWMADADDDDDYDDYDDDAPYYTQDELADDWNTYDYWEE